jgi:hypothetical protein
MKTLRQVAAGSQRPNLTYLRDLEMSGRKEKAPPSKKDKAKEEDSAPSTWLQVLAYSVVLIVSGLYAARLMLPTEFSSLSASYPAVAQVEAFFALVEQYSPFHDYDDNNHNLPPKAGFTKKPEVWHS